MGCGGGSQTQTTKQELDPRMNAILYGGGGNSGMYGKAAELFLNRKPEQSVAGFNPLQQFAMKQTANLALDPNFGGRQTTNDVIAKLMGRGGVQYQPQQFSLPQFDTNQMFARQSPPVAISPDAVRPPLIQQQGPLRADPMETVSKIMRRGAR